MDRYQFSYFGTKRKRHHKRKSRLIRKISLWLFILFVAGFVVGGATILIIFKNVAKDIPDPNQLKNRQMAQSTKIYDRTGEELLYEIHGEKKRTMIKINEIPRNIILATISAEDRQFYKHKGINLRGLLRAIYRDIFHGRFEGGSSITQQLVTNALLSRGTNKWQMAKRKMREWILAYQIEKKFSKEEILQMYLNEVPYGSNAYGIEAAAKTFFGKSAKDINLAESALLAALPNRPTRYSPYGSHQDKMYERQKWILRTMRDEKYITENEYEQAVNKKLIFKPKDRGIIAPHFVMYVKEYLSEKYGELMLERGGLKITTTLDLYKQKIGEKIIKEKTKNYPEKYNATNAALLALDAKTGQILAMIGSRDYYNDEIDGQVNITTRPRQPGSSFKPIVYAAAFKKGYTSDTILWDVVTKFKNYPKDYEPHNYNGDENGPVTIRKALAGSLNIPAVKTIYLTGVKNVLDFADNLKYSTLKDRSRFGLSLVLGGGEVKMIEHLNAFSAFARDGVWKPTNAILKVENSDGKVLEEFKLKEEKKFDTQIARLINNILSDNNARAFAFGTNNYLTLGKRPVAVKTGTTDNYRDAWTLGYTPSLSVGVWVGNNDFTEMKKGAAGGTVAAPIWNSFMKKILGDTPIEYFKKPKPIKVDKPVLNGEYKISYTVKLDKISGKLATKFTPTNLIEEKTFYGFHNILYYLNKDDPRGESNGRQDEQFNNWENSVQRWVKEQTKKEAPKEKENPFVVETPPTEYDDTHTSENQPKVYFNDPSNNSTITDRNFSATINYTMANGEPKKAKYYLDDKLLKIITRPPFTNFDFYFSKISNGFHSLKVELYDDKGNFGVDEIIINILLDSKPITVNWLGPISGSSFATTAPISLNIKVSDYTQTQKVDFFSDNNLIETVTNFNSDGISVIWVGGGAGPHQLQAKVYDKSGKVYETEAVKIILN